MTFASGDRVHIAGVGTGVVRGARNGGRYQVEIKGRTLIVAGRELQPAPPTGRAREPRSPTAPAELSPSRATPSGSLDLHGKTVAETLEALDGFLSDACLDSQSEVRVIHGRSGGRVKTAVHQRLTQLPSVRSFRLDPRNPGVTIVLL